MTDCVFCKILRKEIPATFVAEEDDWAAFRDIHPQAPTHVLVVPRAHVRSLNEVADRDATLLGRLLLAAKAIAAREGVDRSGYRVVVNTNADAGQSVDHLHLHVLGGRALRWPPG